MTISVAFLRFYDEQDFSFLGLIGQPRVWSNRLTVAAFVVAVVNFCVEWDRRNRETSRLAEAERRREEEAAQAEARSAEERERATRRARIQNRWFISQIRHQLDPSEQTRAALADYLAFLLEYGG